MDLKIASRNVRHADTLLLAVATFVAIRLTLLILVDASSFPTRSSRYVYAAVPLAGCAAVLLIDLAARAFRSGSRRPA